MINIGIASEISSGEVRIAKMSEVGSVILNLLEFFGFHEIDCARVFDEKGESDMEKVDFNGFMKRMRVKEMAIDGKLKTGSSEIRMSFRSESIGE